MDVVLDHKPTHDLAGLQLKPQTTSSFGLQIRLTDCKLQSAMWYRAVIEDLDSHRPQTELGRAAYDDLIIAVLQHEVLLTRACMYVGHKEQDDRQRQMNIISRDVHEVRMHDAFPNMPHVECWIYVHESCLIPCPES